LCDWREYADRRARILFGSQRSRIDPIAEEKIGGDLAKLDFRSDLKKLKMPMLVLAGQCDRVVDPGRAAQFRAFAPQAEVFTYEKSGHYPFIEASNSFFGTVRRFLRKEAGP
jgi:proline iminopeptidase